jgi:hypothetical protein
MIERRTPEQVTDRAIGAKDFPAVNTVPALNPFGLHRRVAETGRTSEAVRRRVADSAKQDRAVLGDLL